ncbi:MAG: hypothetical protein ABIK43_02470 [candidate division WOR-3 bacterium]
MSVVTTAVGLVVTSGLNLVVAPNWHAAVFTVGIVTVSRVAVLNAVLAAVVSMVFDCSLAAAVRLIVTGTIVLWSTLITISSRNCSLTGLQAGLH